MMHRLLPTNYAENRLGARDERVEPAEEATRCAGGHVRRTSARAERCNTVSEPVELELAGKTVRVTSPDKVFFTKRGETKLDLIDYYTAVAEPMMAVVGGRPALCNGSPMGLQGRAFGRNECPKERLTG
jgi:hypothetical protein